MSTYFVQTEKDPLQPEIATSTFFQPPKSSKTFGILQLMAKLEVSGKMV